MSKMPIWQQLAMGGTSVVPAVVLTHPIDVIKLRLQLQGYVGASVGAGAGAGVVQAVQYDGTVSGIARIAREEGMSRLFAGLSPALARAFTFSATRIGLYEPLRAGFSDLAGVTEPTFGVKLAAGLSSGALGKFVEFSLIFVSSWYAFLYTIMLISLTLFFLVLNYCLGLM